MGMKNIILGLKKNERSTVPDASEVFQGFATFLELEKYKAEIRVKMEIQEFYRRTGSRNPI
jgi:hypothetical protein